MINACLELQVFGVAANPAVVAKPVVDQRLPSRQERQTEATSKPKTLKRYCRPFGSDLGLLQDVTAWNDIHLARRPSAE